MKLDCLLALLAPTRSFSSTTRTSLSKTVSALCDNPHTTTLTSDLFVLLLVGKHASIISREMVVYIVKFLERVSVELPDALVNAPSLSKEEFTHFMNQLALHLMRLWRGASIAIYL
mmetsp:Transcript_30873/g.39759  ORF Transcript_30873/g.39759 Transcript_30873/m.39759 type:complete len:116 (-) Transcript_30873:364-711(-)